MSGPITNAPSTLPFLRTTAGPDEIAALMSTAPTSSTTSLPATHGSGQATKPSSTGPLAFMTAKFQQFMGAMSDLRQTIGAKFDSVKYAVMDRILAFGSNATEETYEPSMGVTKPTVDPNESRSEVYSAILAHSNATKDLGTFLRSKEGHSEHFSAANFEASNAFAKDLARTLGPDSKVAFAAKHYDPITTAYKHNERSEIGLKNVNAVEQATVKTIVNAFSMLFGNDAISSKIAASNFSQATKDLYVTGMRAIADSNLPVEMKGEAVKRLQADVILRTVNPAISSYGADSKNQATGMKEIAKALQNFVNLGTFQTGKEPVNAEVLKALTSEIPNFRTNMDAMFAEMGAQGRVNEHDVERGQFKVEALMQGRIDVPQTNDGVFSGEAARLGRIGV